MGMTAPSHRFYIDYFHIPAEIRAGAFRKLGSVILARLLYCHSTSARRKPCSVFAGAFEDSRPRFCSVKIRSKQQVPTIFKICTALDPKIDTQTHVEHIFPWKPLT